MQVTKWEKTGDLISVHEFIPAITAYSPGFDQKRYIRCSTNIESYSVIRSMEHDESEFDIRR